MLSSVSEPLRKWQSFVQLGSLHCDVCTSIALGFRGLLQRCPRHPARIISPQCLSSLLTSLSPPPSGCLMHSDRLLLSSGCWDSSVHFQPPVSHERLPATYALQPSCLSPHWSRFWTVPPPTHPHAACSRDLASSRSQTPFSLLAFAYAFSPDWNSSFSLQLSAEASVLPGKITDSSSEVFPQLIVL